MAPRPTLALLVPAYNAADHLPRLLESAARQDEPFDEIWVYDDCSTDDTARVAEAYGACVIRGSVNVGCTEGKRRLLEKTSTGWVHFHDADDELLPAFTQTARALISEHDADVIVVGNEERSEVNPNHLAVSIPDPRELITNPFSYSIRYKVNAISGIYNREFLRRTDAMNIDPAMSHNEDQAIQLRLVLAGARFVATREVLVRSYRQATSMSQSNALKCLESHFAVMRLALENAAARDDAGIINSAVVERLWVIAAGAPRYGGFETAINAARLARTLERIPDRAGGPTFRLLAAVSPAFAILVREYATRILKPHLRRV